MKAIILAAGYATRLYPLTLNKAKPLLPVADKPIINYIIDGLCEIPEIDKIYVVTNNKFYKDFCEWRDKTRFNPPSPATFSSEASARFSPRRSEEKDSMGVSPWSFNKDVLIVNDKTTSDGNKLGAIGDIDLVVRENKIDDDIVVVAGDNLFSFHLKNFVDFFKNNGLSIASYQYPYKNELSSYGIVEIDKDNRIIGFQEKPKQPKSDLVALCVYGFPREKLSVIRDYLKEGNNKDAPGYYIEWLCLRENVFSCIFNGTWHDIGSHEAYERAQKEYSGEI